MKVLLLAQHILSGAIILILLAIPTIPLIITATSWEGTCHGFTDGVWKCPWTEFATNQMGYMTIFSTVPLLCFGGLWLLLTLLHFFLKKRTLSDVGN